MTQPYAKLPPHHFWYRAMSEPAPGHVDPVVRRRTILPTERIATMGSCFAQHLSKNIARSGFNYFVAEQAPADMDPALAVSRNYGVFSARYGNVYTVRQALQLFDRAFGISSFEEHVWTRNGAFVDGFRPQIEPDGFASREALLADRSRHLASVLRIFEQSDWLIFTLGLTEAWRSKRDGAIFPVAPGVSGGSFDAAEHEFVNFRAAEVSDDLRRLVRKLRSVNPKLKLLLTVSPVPLIATYENRHVLVSTTASKAILRVAADEIESEFADVIYFPSYEIITSPASGSRYFQDDLRQVTDTGVGHVMRVFSTHFLREASAMPALPPAGPSTAPDDGREKIVCDEEEIERAIRQAGF